MTESFSEMFEQSLANQRIRPGMILMGLVVDVGPDVVIINVGLKSERCTIDQFKNELGEVESRLAIRSKWHSTPSKTARRALIARRPSELGPGPASNRPSMKARSTAHIRRVGWLPVDIETVRAFLPGSLVDVPGARHGYLETNRWNSRSSNSTRSATTSWSRAALARRPAEVRSWTTCRKAPGGAPSESHRLWSVCRPRWHRWPAAHHRHGLETRQAPLGSGQGW